MKSSGRQADFHCHVREASLWYSFSLLDTRTVEMHGLAGYVQHSV